MKARPQDIDKIVIKIDILVKEKGISLKNPFWNVTPEEFKKLMEYVEKLERAY